LMSYRAVIAHFYSSIGDDDQTRDHQGYLKNGSNLLKYK
jgi:hypothetical protein